MGCAISQPLVEVRLDNPKSTFCVLPPPTQVQTEMVALTAPQQLPDPLAGSHTSHTH